MIVLVRGGGDLASGVVLRLHRAGLKVLITELPIPLAVRRLVSFSEAVLSGEASVEGVGAKRVLDPGDALRMMNIWAKGQIPVVIDPEANAIAAIHPTVVVDARLLKKAVSLPTARVNLLIGLGPGFTPGVNCHAAVETARGPWLGRVYWNSSPLDDTGRPEDVLAQSHTRVLRAPIGGKLKVFAKIGEIVEPNQLLAQVENASMCAMFRGVLRGILPDGIQVEAGVKIGDLDPRCDPGLCTIVSDKALAVAGGVLEAILSKPELRKNFWA